MENIIRLIRRTNWQSKALNGIPCRCKACDQTSASLLCETCQLALSRSYFCCHQCGERLPELNSQSGLNHINRCGRCIALPPAFASTLFAYRYEGALVKLIQQFKFNGDLILSKLLADMMIDKIRNAQTPLADMIIPVPLHHSRLKQRGFNQSIELARHISHSLEIPMIKNIALRTRATPKQSGLDRKARVKNIQGAFSINPSYKDPDLTNKHLAIVDDVITTGSTVRELAKVLKRLKPKHICVLAVAKTQR